MVQVQLNKVTVTQTKKGTKNMERKWELYDKLLECIGGEELSLSICKALSSDDMNDCLEYIANCFDIEYEED